MANGTKVKTDTEISLAGLARKAEEDPGSFGDAYDLALASQRALGASETPERDSNGTERSGGWRVLFVGENSLEVELAKGNRDLRRYKFLHSDSVSHDDLTKHMQTHYQDYDAIVLGMPAEVAKQFCDVFNLQAGLDAPVIIADTEPVKEVGRDNVYWLDMGRIPETFLRQVELEELISSGIDYTKNRTVAFIVMTACNSEYLRLGENKRIKFLEVDTTAEGFFDARRLFERGEIIGAVVIDGWQDPQQLLFDSVKGDFPGTKPVYVGNGRPEELKDYGPAIFTSHRSAVEGLPRILEVHNPKKNVDTDTTMIKVVVQKNVVRRTTGRITGLSRRFGT